MTGSLAGSFSEKTRAGRWAEVLASPAHREGRDQAGSSGLGWIMGGVQLHVPDCLPPLSQFGDPLGERGAGQSSTHTWESSDRFYSDEEGAPVLGKPGPEQGSPEPQSPQTDFTQMKREPQSSGSQGLSRGPLGPGLLLAGPNGRATESSLGLLLTEKSSISGTS